MRRPLRRSSRTLLAALGFFLVGIAPLVIVAVASGVASALGCRLDEGSVHPCLFAGHDLGGLLYTLSMFGWLALLSIWFVLFAIVAAAIGLVQRLRERAAG